MRRGKNMNKDIKKELTGNESSIMQKHFGQRGGFRKNYQRLSAMKTLYKIICAKCKRKLFKIYADPETRLEKVKDPTTYCAECMPKVIEWGRNYS